MSRVKQIRNKPVAERGQVIARLFKGGKKKPHPTKQGVMIAGDDLDHFRVEWEDVPSVNKEWAQQCWTELYGEKPAYLQNVRFLTDNAESALSSINEKWGASKGVPICTTRCDGENIFYQWTGDSVSRDPAPCNFPACKCAFTYRLRIWLPEFTNKSGILGEFLLTAHSKEEYERSILPIVDRFGNAGLLRQVAFTLYRRHERIVQPNGTPVMKWLVALDSMEAGAQALALAAAETVALIPASTQTSQEHIAGSQMDVTFEPLVSIRNDAGYVEYRFIDKYGTVYSTADSDLIQRAAPEIAKLAVGKKHTLEMQLSGTVSGNTVIELRSDPIPF